MRARDHDVDLLRARRDARLDLREPRTEGTQPRREPRAHRRDRNVAARERGDRDAHQLVIHAHRRHGDPEMHRAERVQDVVAHRFARLRAQTPHIARRVVAREGGEIDERDGAQQPRRLPILLHRAPRGDRRRAALHRAPVHADRIDDVEIERHTGIPRVGVLQDEHAGRGGSYTALSGVTLRTIHGYNLSHQTSSDRTAYRRRRGRYREGRM